MSRPIFCTVSSERSAPRPRTGPRALGEMKPYPPPAAETRGVLSRPDAPSLRRCQVCYLQTWQAPALNAAALALLTVICLSERAWAAALLLWPLTLGALVPFIGCCHRALSPAPPPHLPNPMTSTLDFQPYTSTGLAGIRDTGV